MRLEALPLTPNGKLDRKALPAPDGKREEAGYVAPRTEMEAAVAAIWAAVLKLDRVGVHDNFFAIGGHSLLAVTVIERLRQSGFAADVRTLFLAPTPAELVVALNGGRQEIQVPPNKIPAGCRHITPEMLTLVSLTREEIGRIVGAVPGGAANIQDIYPLAPLQQGILFHHLLSAESDAYVLASVIRFQSSARLRAFLDALQLVIDRHDILRTAVHWEGLSEPVQVVWRSAKLAAEEIDVAADGGDALEQLTARSDPRHYRLDVRKAPMVRAIIAEDKPAAGWLLQILSHHLVTDHMTVELIIAEVGTILNGQAAQLPVALPFREFIAQARLGIDEAESEAFFKAMLADVTEPSLPFGLSDARGDGSDIEEAVLSVDPLLAEKIHRVARQLKVSAASVMHLAWAQVLSRICGRQDVVFGTVLFGRMQAGAGSRARLGCSSTRCRCASACAGRCGKAWWTCTRV